ncbi:hypothetical protein CL659_03885 [bacterium]|nr:hypothetical protein [bacterium]|tara:strand:- start:18196 stop:19440 length:1245 start_codon:yes stop_codon:yes gene_type:complete
MFWLKVYKFLGIVFFELFKFYLLISGKSSEFNSLRMGSFPDFPKSRIWVHSVSVGELKAVIPFIKELKKRKYKIVLSVGTRAGFKLAKSIYGKDASVFVTVIPFDCVKTVKIFLNKLKPTAVFFVETELWPLFIDECKKKSIPLFWLNGRVSDRVFKSKGIYRIALSWMIPQFDLCLMRSLEDLRKASLISSSGHYGNIKGVCLGDIKYDKPFRKPTLKRSDFGIRDEKIIVLGSSHEGEEKIAFSLFEKLLKKFKNLKLIIAPRKLERIEHIKKILSNRKVLNWSNLNKGNKEMFDVLMIDEMGTLSQIYSIADIALIGGSWVKRGGHNPIEPCFFGIPTIFGPSMENFREVAGDLINSGGAISASEYELLDIVENLLSDDSKRKEVGLLGLEAVNSRKGISKRMINEVEFLL